MTRSRFPPGSVQALGTWRLPPARCIMGTAPAQRCRQIHTSWCYRRPVSRGKRPDLIPAGRVTQCVSASGSASALDDIEQLRTFVHHVRLCFWDAVWSLLRLLVQSILAQQWDNGDTSERLCSRSVGETLLLRGRRTRTCSTWLVDATLLWKSLQSSLETVLESDT